MLSRMGEDMLIQGNTTKRKRRNRTMTMLAWRLAQMTELLDSLEQPQGQIRSWLLTRNKFGKAPTLTITFQWGRKAWLHLILKITTGKRHWCTPSCRHWKRLQIMVIPILMKSSMSLLLRQVQFRISKRLTKSNLLLKKVKSMCRNEKNITRLLKCLLKSSLPVTNSL